MEDKKYAQLQVAGSLYIPGLNGGEYQLLSPRPIRNIDEISDGGPKKFYVASGPRSKARLIIVNGPYVIDYFSAGKTIEVEMMKQEEDEIPSELLEICVPAYQVP